MRRVLILCLSPLILTACEEPGGRDVTAGPLEASAPDAPTAEAPTTSLGGVDLAGDLRLIGTEPFWGVDMQGAQIVYSGVGRPEQTAVRPEPVIAGTTATWSSTASTGAELVVTVIDTPCSDGMSDRTYPLTARVVIGDETLNGCAATPGALASVGEGGPVMENSSDEG